MDPVKTIFRSYCFNLRNGDEREAYAALCNQLRAQGLKRLRMRSGRLDGRSSVYEGLNGREITLEVEHLFSDQWNAAPLEGSGSGLRVFDWYEEAVDDEALRLGHYLLQTPQMAELRRNTHKCGYCGAQATAGESVFCPRCAGSEHLKESELHLTRMAPIDTTDQRAGLTDAEKAEQLPFYREAQTVGSTARGKARIAELRGSIAARYRNVVENAKTEHDGTLWLIDHGFAQLAADNTIYYTHTARFCFGQALAEPTLSALLAAVSEFPAPYEIKTSDGRTLAGG